MGKPKSRRTARPKPARSNVIPLSPPRELPPERRAALARAAMIGDLLRRVTRTLEDKDATGISALLATAIVDKLWEPFGHDVSHSATMCLIDCIARAAERDAPGELAQYRETWGVVVDPESFHDAVRAKRAGGNEAWWPKAYASIQSAGLKPQSRQAVKKAWDRWRANFGQWHLLPRPAVLPGLDPGT